MKKIGWISNLKTMFSGLAASLCIMAVFSGCAGGGLAPRDGGTGSPAHGEETLQSRAAAKEEGGAEPGIEFGSYENVTPGELLKAKNPYIGDAPANGKAIDLTKSYFGISVGSTMELQTTEEPYRLTLHYQEKPDGLAARKAAAVLLSLIDNCHSVTWDYPLDEAGNREYFFLTISSASQMTEGGSVKSFSQSEEEFQKLLGLLENVTEPCLPLTRAPGLEAAVSAAILEYNRDLFPGDSEVQGEGHVTLDTEEGEGKATVYALTIYGIYQFQDGNFVKDGGTGVLPVVIELKEEPDGAYVALNYKRPLDGSLYEESIEQMFPQELWDACIFPTDEARTSLGQQEQAYAKAYLDSIGREAAVGEFGDFPHLIPSQAGISVDVSNRIDENRKHSNGGPVAYAPFWFGTIERVEEGVRYIYEHSYNQEDQEILFSKINYETGEIEEQEIFDSLTGEKKE